MTDIPTVYAWCAGLYMGGPDEIWFAMCDDGEVLGNHVSSNRGFGQGDVHLTFANNRTRYEAKFGGLGERFYHFVVLPAGEQPPPEVWAANRVWAADEDEAYAEGDIGPYPRRRVYTAQVDEPR